ncbi:hypothetical protein PVAP13_6KG343100 [Panicum virgatum]|uniref:Uncharacterized protein n=1 Tax=Panicum virgatum TaxID=38727 RepID=A0A8T0RJF1_PANVG|nr:hypothetical protein PVAP13_6KG343100 [Panicum virgatum]
MDKERPWPFTIQNTHPLPTIFITRAPRGCWTIPSFKSTVSCRNCTDGHSASTRLLRQAAWREGPAIKFRQQALIKKREGRIASLFIDAKKPPPRRTSLREGIIRQAFITTAGRSLKTFLL